MSTQIIKVKPDANSEIIHIASLIKGHYQCPQKKNELVMFMQHEGVEDSFDEIYSFILQTRLSSEFSWTNFNNTIYSSNDSCKLVTINVIMGSQLRVKTYDHLMVGSKIIMTNANVKILFLGLGDNR